MITPLIKEFVTEALSKEEFEVTPTEGDYWIDTYGEGGWRFLIYQGDSDNTLLEVEMHDPDYPNSDESRWIYVTELPISDPEVMIKLVKILNDPITYVEKVMGCTRDCALGDPNDPNHKEYGVWECINSMCHHLWDNEYETWRGRT